MGNSTSCAPSIISSSSAATKVLSSDGKTEVYTRAVKVAEIMLENPGRFVCDADSLKVGHRIQGLSADDDLLKRRLYLLLPMDLLYSVLTPEELASFASYHHNNSSSNKSSRHNNNDCGGSLAYFAKSKISIFPSPFPSLGEFCMFLPDNNKSETNKSALGSPLSDSEPRVERLYSKERSWRPALETIVETSPQIRLNHVEY